MNKKELKKVTVLEEYKLKVLDLMARLNSVNSGDCTNEVLELIIESCDKLNEMMDIIVDVGEANGRLASALQIMLDDLRDKKYDWK